MITIISGKVFMNLRCFAHRGYSGRYPENTILAFEKALSASAEGIELDVHLSKDGIPVIIHDERLERTTNGTGFVCDYTAEQLNKLNACYVFKEHGFVPLPTLEEYFVLVKPYTSVLTNIELKTNVNEYPGIETAVLQLIDRYSMRDNVIISSFNHYSVKRFKQLAADVKCAFLTSQWGFEMGAYCKRHGADFIHPIYNSVLADTTAEYYQELEQSGIGINTWTVNDEQDMKRLLDMNINGLITDFPDVFLHARREIKGF